jgi:hypothetical protein
MGADTLQTGAPVVFSEAAGCVPFCGETPLNLLVSPRVHVHRDKVEITRVETQKRHESGGGSNSQFPHSDVTADIAERHPFDLLAVSVHL